MDTAQQRRKEGDLLEEGGRVPAAPAEKEGVKGKGSSGEGETILGQGSTQSEVNREQIESFRKKRGKKGSSEKAISTESVFHQGLGKEREDDTREEEHHPTCKSGVENISSCLKRKR